MQNDTWAISFIVQMHNPTEAIQLMAHHSS